MNENFVLCRYYQLTVFTLGASSHVSPLVIQVVSLDPLLHCTKFMQFLIYYCGYLRHNRYNLQFVRAMNSRIHPSARHSSMVIDESFERHSEILIIRVILLCCGFYIFSNLLWRTIVVMATLNDDNRQTSDEILLNRQTANKKQCANVDEADEFLRN